MAGKPGTAKQNSKSGLSALSRGYLILYNGAQFAGWSYLLYQVIKHYATGNDITTLWDTVRPTVMIFQNAAVLEVFHVIWGLVKSSPVVTAMQVASRVMVVCGVLAATPTAPQSPGLPLLLFCWSITEIIRYLFYTLNLISYVPYAVVWCRYTFFYALYPFGVTGELLCFYAAQSFAKQTKLFSIELPNRANFTFSYHYLLLGIMASYVPLFPKMFFHMVSQRKKTIGGSSDKKEA